MSVKASFADVRLQFQVIFLGIVKSQVVSSPKVKSLFLLSASANEHKVIEVIKSRVLNFQVESHGIYFQSSQVLSHQNSDLS